MLVELGIFWLVYFSLENKSWNHKIEEVINLYVWEKMDCK